MRLYHISSDSCELHALSRCPNLEKSGGGCGPLGARGRDGNASRWLPLFLSQSVQTSQPSLLAPGTFPL